MDLLFFTDVKFIKSNNNYYALNLNNTLWPRYLELFDNIQVYSRVVELDKYDGLTIANSNNVCIQQISSYSKITDLIFNRKKIFDEVSSKLKNKPNSKIIIRLPSSIGLVACDICEKNKIDYLIEMVACPFDAYYNHSSVLGKLIAPMMMMLNRRAIKKSNNVLYVTDKFLQKRYPNNKNNIGCSDVVLPSIIENMFDDKNIKYKEFKTILNLGTVGNVELKYKGQIYVLKALRKLNKINKKYHYYMIGGGNKTRLLNYVKKYKMERDVTFIDNIPHEQVLKELMNIDIYIQPSLQEGMPRALIEAMSVGCVCVGSNAGGIPELLSDKYIFKKRKYMHLVKIIKMLETASLKEISIENHHRATDFNRDKLDEKRRRFYMNFKNNMR